LKNSEKHSIIQADSAKEVRDELKMAAIAMGWSEIEAFRKHPIFTVICDMAPPLKWGSTTLDVMMECAKYGIPIHIETDCALGTTAPVTVTGLIIQQNAEILSGITLIQLINPGCPVIYAHAPFTSDLRTGLAMAGGAERVLITGATLQLAQMYEIPACGIGGATDSKIPDVQAGYEKAISFLMLALEGHNIIQGGLGMIETHMSVSMEQSVIDDEILKMVFRILRGSEISERTISEAIDVIRAVGPLGSHYMSQPHTLQNLSTEIFVPELIDRRGRMEWEKDKRGVLENARSKAEKILKEHQVEQLPPDVMHKIEEIARAV
jgi:trimethylamine--corrinoid protein Co-methyltransferase